MKLQTVLQLRTDHHHLSTMAKFEISYWCCFPAWRASLCPNLSQPQSFHFICGQNIIQSKIQNNSIVFIGSSLQGFQNQPLEDTQAERNSWESNSDSNQSHTGKGLQVHEELPSVQGPYFPSKLTYNGFSFRVTWI